MLLMNSISLIRQSNYAQHFFRTVNWSCRLVDCRLCSSLKRLPIEECLCSAMRWKRLKDCLIHIPTPLSCTLYFRYLIMMTWSHRNVVQFFISLVFILKCFTKPLIIVNYFYVIFPQGNWLNFKILYIFVLLVNLFFASSYSFGMNFFSIFNCIYLIYNFLVPLLNKNLFSFSAYLNNLCMLPNDNALKTSK